MCAKEIQRSIVAYNEERPGEAIHVRIGLHHGRPIKDTQDFFSRDVVVASRIAQEAQGDEILVSSVVRELVGNAQDIRFGETREMEIPELADSYQVHPMVGEWSPPGQQ